MMALELMYITNDPSVAKIAEDAGVDIIFIDMEFIGKSLRQGGMDTVQCHHKIDDVKAVRAVLNKAKLMVRVNPIHEAGEENGYYFEDSKNEIDAAIEAGADIIMLPYFHKKEELEEFVQIVDGRATTFPLLETNAAYENLDELLTVAGIDQMHIGLNDLSLDQGKPFMFEQLADGTVDDIADKLVAHNIPFGFGGIARPGAGMLPAEYIIRDHHRLGSSFVILSRSFCNTSVITDQKQIREIFVEGVKEIRQIEAEADLYTDEQFASNHEEVQRRVAMVSEAIKRKRI